MGFLGSLFGGGASAASPAPMASSAAVMGFPSVGMGQQQPVQPKKAFRDTGFANVLGMLGDALTVYGGGQPTYAPMRAERQAQQRQEQANAALANYLGNLDPGLRDLVMAAGPEAAMSAYGIAHPKASGKPSFVEEYEYRQALDPTARADFDSFAERRKFNPYAAPITLGQGDTIEYPGAQGGPQEVTATGPNGEKVRLNPSTGQWEPVGGPTAGPSAGFPQ